MMQKLTDSLTGIAMGGIGSPVLQRYPSLTPLLLFLGFQTVQAANPVGEKKEEITYSIHFRYGIDFTVAYCMEFAFPFNIDDDDSFQTILQAIQFVINRVETAAKGTITLRIIISLKTFTSWEAIPLKALGVVFFVSSPISGFFRVNI